MTVTVTEPPSYPPPKRCCPLPSQNDEPSIRGRGSKRRSIQTGRRGTVPVWHYTMTDPWKTSRGASRSNTHIPRIRYARLRKSQAVKVHTMIPPSHHHIITSKELQGGAQLDMGSSCNILAYSAYAYTTQIPTPLYQPPLLFRSRLTKSCGKHHQRYTAQKQQWR